MSALRAAILIVNYRVYDELDRALASLDPYLGDDEVVVFDQVSDAARLDTIVRRYPRVRTIPSAINVGFAAGVNAAARTTQAPYLLLLNPDAIVEGPVAAVLADWLETHPRTGVVGPRIVEWDGSVQASARRFPGPSVVLAGRSSWLSRRFPGNWLSRRNLLTAPADDARDVDWLAGSCFLTRRDLFDRLGGFDERFFLYWEDADYCQRVRAAGFEVVYLPRVSVRHQGGASAARNRAQAIRAFHRSAAYLYRKHAGPLARPWAGIVAAGLRARGEWKVSRVSRG